MASTCVRLLLLLSCVTGPGVVSDILRPSCASGWFYHRSHCYGYFRKAGNWSHAELECQSYGNGSHLASVLNHKEASVISKYITGYQRNLPVWIGLHDPQKKQLWRWIDGSTHLESWYRPWNPRTKNEARHCAELNPKDRFLTWNKNRCNESQHFLCKYRP
ncbi:reproteinrating islet-derived protein 4 [Sigmodon hispidus]